MGVRALACLLWGEGREEEVIRKFGNGIGELATGGGAFWASAALGAGGHFECCTTVLGGVGGIGGEGSGRVGARAAQQQWRSGGTVMQMR